MLRKVLTVVVGTATLVALAGFSAGADPPAARDSADRSAVHRLALKASVRAVHAPGRPGTRASWSTAGTMKTAVDQTGGAAFLKNKVYVAGGLTSFTNPPKAFAHMQVLAPATNTWTSDPDLMPAAPSGGGWADGAVCTDGSKVYVVNGEDGSFIYSAMQIFDPSAPAGSKWSFGPNPSTTTAGNWYGQDSGCAWIGGKLYLFGGYGLSDTGPQPTTTAGPQKATWAFDPATGLWSDTGLLMKKAAFWFGYTSSKKQAFVAGGTGNATTDLPLAATQAFTPVKGWKSLANLPTPAGANTPGLLAPGMGMLGTTLEVFAGGGENTTSSTFFLQTTTLSCASPCTAASTWTGAGKTLVTARWFFGFTSGAVTSGMTSNPTLFAAGGGAVGPAILKSAEKTT